MADDRTPFYARLTMPHTLVVVMLLVIVVVAASWMVSVSPPEISMRRWPL